MHRFYADGLGEIGSLVTLSEEDARHASRVLRMQPGDAAELFLDGRRFSAEIAEMTADGVTARLISELPSTEATLRITLYQGLPKAEKMELIVQKAVELGAARVVPVAMSRCVVQLSVKDGAKKQERWQKIAREACKQSGRCQMMAVDAPIAFPALLTALKTHEAAIVPWEDARGYSLTAFHREHPGIRLKIVSGRSAKVVSMLRSGAVDIAFASSPKDSTLETWPCFTTHSVFVAGKNYHCDFDKIYTRQEMAEFPLILLERKASSRVFLEQEFLKAGVTLTPEIELSSRQLLVTLAGIGLGVAGVTLEFVRKDLESGDIRLLKTDFTIPERSVDMCTLKEVPPTAAATAFMEMVRRGM